MGNNLLPVISALWFLQSRSLYNAAKARLLRLRQPRYLIGGIVGIGYLWAVFFRRFFQTRTTANIGGWDLSPETAGWIEAAAALALAVYVVSVWVFAGDRASLAFTEAEVSFLLPAPVSRSALLNFRLLRAQPGILLSTFFFNLFTGRSHSLFEWFSHGFTLWLVFTLLFLHSIGASFAIQRLTERGLAGWRRRLVVLTIVLCLVGAVYAWIQAAPAAAPVRDLDALQDRIRALMSAGPAPWLLAPFRWVVRPWFTRTLSEFLVALGPALLILVGHYLWVVRANVSFEEAALEASRKAAVLLAAARSGNLHQLAPPKVRRDPFPLPSLGFPPLALLWKNLIAAGQLFTGRIWFFALLGIGTFVVTSALTRDSFSGLQNASMIATSVSMMLLMMSLFLGAQVVRHDFRSDLAQMDMLKALPLPAWQVVLGQLLAPIVILTAFQWLLLGVLLGGSLGLSGKPDDAITPWRFPGVLSAAFLFPGINALVLLLPNTIALLFPAWAGTQQGRGGGIEVMGQRLVFSLGFALVLVIGLLPAGIIGALCWWIAQLVVGPAWALPIAALPAALVLLAEFAAGVRGLAFAFDRYDVTSP
jgi:hypothetical protein